MAEYKPGKLTVVTGMLAGYSAPVFCSTACEIYVLSDPPPEEFTGRKRAEIIARAVSCHDELVAACERYLALYDEVHHGVDKGQTPAMMRAVLAKAKAK